MRSNSLARSIEWMESCPKTVREAKSTPILPKDALSDQSLRKEPKQRSEVPAEKPVPTERGKQDIVPRITPSDLTGYRTSYHTL